MYENESDKVRLGIEFLSALLEKDYRTDPTFDPEDLASKMLEIADDIQFLRSNLDLEVADDVEGAREELTDDTLEEDELEDEIVECTRLIDRAVYLFGAVRKQYFPKDESEEVEIKKEVVAEVPEPKKEPIKHRKRRLDDTGQIGVALLIIFAIAFLIAFLNGSFD